MIERLVFGLTLVSLALQPARGQSTNVPTQPSKEFAGMEVLQVVNGSNSVDLDGDGQPDLVFVGWRDNFNAHGSDVLTFYVWYTNEGYERYPEKRWYLASFFDAKGDSEATNLYTEQGADCVLRDYRIVRPSGQPQAPVMVIAGRRDIGNSFADVQAVTFVVYQLTRNTEEIPGYPPFYFKHLRRIRGRGRYCDINEAFQSELGLGPREPWRPVKGR